MEMNINSKAKVFYAFDNFQRCKTLLNVNFSNSFVEFYHKNKGRKII